MRGSLRRIVVLVLVLCVVLSAAAPVTALQSRIQNYSKDYELTGNGPADMIAIAFAQLEKTGKQLGYSEQWCCDFVSDCAILAGQVDAIPSFAYCYGLYQAILDAGGKKVTSSPKPGDICFINWDGKTALKHVEIVYKVENGNVYTIGGNTGGGDDLYVRRVFTHDPLPDKNIVVILRPDYKTIDMSYATKCTSYPSNCKIQIAADSASIMSQPCTSDTDSESTVVTTAGAGAEFTAVALYENTLGQFWYRVSLDGKAAYIAASDASFSEAVMDMTLSSLTAPEKLVAGYPFTLKGKLQTTGNRLGTVTAKVLSGEKVILEASVKVNDSYFSLQHGTFTEKLTWDKLEPGDYTLVISGTLTGYYVAEDGTRSTYSTAAEPLSCGFTVTEHTCIFDIFTEYEAKHPHYAVYECVCGKTKTSTKKTAELEECEICFPKTPVPMSENMDLFGEVCFHPFFASCDHCE